MIQVYKNGTLTTLSPIYGDDLALDGKKEGDNVFLRYTPTGEITFLLQDYVAISSASLDDEFKVYLDGEYLGKFYKSDAVFDVDNQSCTTSLRADDEYETILASLDKEYDLVALAPKRESVTLKKRAILQIYAFRDSKVTNVVGNMSYEVDINSGVNLEELTPRELTEDFHFSLIGTAYSNFKLRLFDEYASSLPYLVGTYEYQGGTRFVNEHGYYFDIVPQAEEEIVETIYDENGNPVTARREGDQEGNVCLKKSPRIDYSVESAFIVGIHGDGYATIGEANAYAHHFYGRVLLDLIPSSPLSGGYAEISATDLCVTNLNYHYAMPVGENDLKSEGLTIAERIVQSSEVQDAPTKWGVNGEGKYFVRPDALHAQDNIFPIGWSRWIPTSFWFNSSSIFCNILDFYDADVTINDAYPLDSAISVLLAKIDPSIHYGASSSYSHFFYDTRNEWINYKLFITPITNIKKTYYNQAARKGAMTLGQIFNMLKTCFNCYWSIETVGGVKNLRIEHISWYEKGGTYRRDTRNATINFSSIIAPKSKKSWEYGQSKFSYDLSHIYSRYEYSWNEESFEPFNGFAIDILNDYCKGAGTLKSQASNFMSDLDLIISAPDVLSDDTFAIISTTDNNNTTINRVEVASIGTPRFMAQNGILSLLYLENRFLLYNMSGDEARADEYNSTIPIDSVMRLKKQSIEAPCLLSQVKNWMGMFVTAIGLGNLESVKRNFNTEYGEFEIAMRDDNSRVVRVTPSKITLGTGVETQTIHISAGTPWSFTYPSWITPSQSSGIAGEHDITLTSSLNNTGGVRYGTIGVSLVMGAFVGVHLEQEYDGVFASFSRIEPTSYGSTAQEITFGVISNVDGTWSVQSSESWLVPTANPNMVVANLSANTSGAQRTATLTLSIGGVTTDTLTITQKGQQYYVTPSTSSFRIPAKAGSSRPMSLDTNIPLGDFMISSSQSWIHDIEVVRTRTSTDLFVNFNENATASERTAEIYLRYQGTTYATYEVTQSAAQSTPTEYDVTINLFRSDPPHGYSLDINGEIRDQYLGTPLMRSYRLMVSTVEDFFSIRVLPRPTEFNATIKVNSYNGTPIVEEDTLVWNRRYQVPITTYRGNEVVMNIYIEYEE